MSGICFRRTKATAYKTLVLMEIPLIPLIIHSKYFTVSPRLIHHNLNIQLQPRFQTANEFTAIRRRNNGITD